MGLLKKAPAFVVGLVAYFAVAHFFGGDGTLKPFEVFDSAEGRFTVSLPGEPEKEIISVPSAIGDLNTVLFSAGTKDAQFAVIYCDYSREIVDGSDPEKILDGARDGAVSNVKGELLSEKKLDIYSSPAREIEVKAPGKVFTTRLILNDRRLYQVMAVLPSDGKNKDKIAEFFDSFKMHKQ